jgi:hypothetical protein
MNAKNLALGIFIALTLILASLTADQYVQITSLSSQIQSNQSKTTSSFLRTSSLVFSVNYGGPWGLTYQVYPGVSESGQLVESGSFYGHDPANESIIVVSATGGGTLICALAQKLDASNSTLILRIADVKNQTSLAYGTTKTCIVDVIG